MEMSRPRVLVVGCGPGSPLYVTEAAHQAVFLSEVLAGSRRLLELFPDHSGRKIEVAEDIAGAMDEIAAAVEGGQLVAVLVSGDPGCFSLSRLVRKRFGRENCDVVAGVSSVQVAFARINLDWTDATILSAHGATPEIAPEELARRDKIAILCGCPAAVQWCARMAECLKAEHVAFVYENLTLDVERTRQVTPDELRDIDVVSLSIVLLVRRSLL